MKHLALAFQFLTIIPVKTSSKISEDDFVKSTSFFILVGLAQAILLIAVEHLSGMLLHPEFVPAVILFTYVLSNGGFHLDGLADTFDAIAVNVDESSVGHKQKRLSIMKEGSTGPIGVLAIIFALSFKYLSLKNLSHFTPFIYYSSIITLPIISKWTMVISMFHGKAAKNVGLGSLFAGKVGLREVAISTFTLISLLLILMFLFSRFAPDFQYLFYLVLVLTLYIFCCLLINFFNKKFGGLTGDTLGAVSEITEVIFLFMVIVWSRLSI